VSHFRLIAAGCDVSGIVAELDAHPELWDQNTSRTESPMSVHHGVRDIWLRWRDPAYSGSFDEPHISAFWPAWHALPSLHPIVRNLSHVVNGVHLGGILITRIPAGEQVRPHTDDGWHARHFDTKLYLVLRANALCLNYCGDEVEHYRVGDVFEFPNSVKHSVVNRGSTDRISVIICFRTMAHDAQAAG